MRHATKNSRDHARTIGLGPIKLRLPQTRLSLMLVCAAAIVLGSPALMLGRELRLKTLDRDVDPVVLRADRLPGLIGSNIESLGLLAVHDGRLEPIPFQVDQRDEQGRYAYYQGVEPNPDQDPALDANDELVFGCWDAGDRLDASPYLPGADAALEIELSDPADNSSGWAYLVRYIGDAPRSEIDYVRYDPLTDEIDAERYELGFSPSAPISIGRQLVKVEAGGSGRSIADRMKIRFSGKVLGLFPLSIDEDGFTTIVTGYIDGPVRLLRRTANWQYLFSLIPTPRTYLDTEFYGRSIGYSLVFHVPFDVGSLLSEPVVRVSTDSNCERPGRRWYNSNNRQGVDVDGVMSPAELTLDRGEFEWTVVAGTLPGERGGWLSRNIYDREDFPLNFELYYRDDMAVPDPPEEQPGSCANTGYTVRGLENIERGDYSLGVVMFPLSDYRIGDETPYLLVDDQPLVATVRPLSIAAAQRGLQGEDRN